MSTSLDSSIKLETPFQPDCQTCYGKFEELCVEENCKVYGHFGINSDKETWSHVVCGNCNERMQGIFDSCFICKEKDEINSNWRKEFIIDKNGVITETHNAPFPPIQVTPEEADQARISFFNLITEISSGVQTLSPSEQIALKKEQQYWLSRHHFITGAALSAITFSTNIFSKDLSLCIHGLALATLLVASMNEISYKLLDPLPERHIKTTGLINLTQASIGLITPPILAYNQGLTNTLKAYGIFMAGFLVEQMVSAYVAYKQIQRERPNVNRLFGDEQTVNS